MQVQEFENMSLEVRRDAAVSQYRIAIFRASLGNYLPSLSSLRRSIPCVHQGRQPVAPIQVLQAQLPISQRVATVSWSATSLC